ncbi:YicC family protein [Ponticoccus sp. SC2-23]|uniref:YicC/YloC family endoribonuclease n=1 Tax=Alexandriicola marinus TaxID=2081710 RepID=UPI000FDC322E|nr:YicC/YloC family endoribonuclease [Alexandriicola marinus]MBM1218849.1 YicC family protein [Ponticoccus sp. SC6-9]MBM1224079.1 YicC family protein [Ponticoccus sp. SC6-15]MBM1230142.1 YicC family protein [Ponticoccus sp. SC6-38]MBM1233045.1 YicC family protein [Ponticoccus sp. SC6-45]MBM1237005.1 YicC family protein [Ponticoccus sp. SC6-49]MBM1242056.1 YicC family protein [Ponticoccus sp. SC2-64]MBM1246569.1 YicC family protein [Ponticoccus sp. SC6-42]MBM1251047.1 YicC family protein [Po
MIRSMTAFASRTGTHGAHGWSWDMRSVNGRGLDLRLRLPDGIEGLEAGLRAAVTHRIDRGNVTIGLRLSRDASREELSLDEARLDRVLRALDAVQDRAMTLGITLGQPSAADVLSQRGVLAQEDSQPDPAETEALRSALLADFDLLLSDFCEMREAEGRALRTILSERLDEIGALLTEAQDAAEARLPVARQALRDAVARLGEAGTDMPEDRLAQELALLAVKADVTEELDRLNAHVDAARTLLSTKGAVGRKLDFLMQEFNREANTLCSKSGSTALTRIGLDLKTLIDQMREQVQNVE